MAIFNQIVKGSGGSAPAHYVEKSVDANGKLVNDSSTVIDLTGVTDLGPYSLPYAYYSSSFPANTVANFSSLTTISGDYSCQCTFRGSSITSIDLGSLITISGNNTCVSMADACSSLTNLDLSSLETISGSCFAMCRDTRNLTSIDLGSLITISGSTEYMFYGSGLTSVDIGSLTTVTGPCNEMFRGTKVASVVFSSLTNISRANAFSSLFASCRSLTLLSFPCLTTDSFGTATTQFNYMLSGVTGCTVHFPSNIQSTIGSWTSVTGGFGGTNTTVLFDLPATVTLTGADTVTYTRNPKYDTATALAWKVGAYGTTNFTPAYYTSGTTDPAVSDAIYSDAACTQSVTTITAIS